MKHYTMRSTGQLKEITDIAFKARITADENAYGLSTVLMLNIAGSKEKGAQHDTIVHVPQHLVRHGQGSTNLPNNKYYGK